MCSLEGKLYIHAEKGGVRNTILSAGRIDLQIRKLTSNQTDNLNCPITIKKLNSLLKAFWKKYFSPDNFIGKFYKHLKKQ